jgi:cytochrome c-type biogenesis protein CcmH
MLLWLSFAVLTALVVWLLLRPLAVASARAEDPARADLAVYRDQLAEIDRDQARGLLAPAEAEAARAEVSRRLIARADTSQPVSTATIEQARVNLGRARTAVMAGVPLFALAGYLVAGSPHLPGQPYAARAKAPVRDVALSDMIGRVEARLREKPEEGQGWDVIAPIYLKLGRFNDARQAYARAISLLGESTKRLAGFAEAAVLAADGVVDEDARQAFSKVAAAEPARPEPRFWLAVALEQDGKFGEAFEAYRALIASAEPSAPWRRSVEERLAVVSAKAGQPAPSDTGRGAAPSTDAVEAVSRLPKAEQDKMIAGMVDGLARRLAQNGNDLAGWQRLLRAYSVLGDGAKAKSALADARRALQRDATALAALNAFASEIGLTP